MSTRAEPVDRRSHWEGVYGAKDESQLSWHQDEPRISFDLVREFCPPGRTVIDVGGGASILAGRLIAAGYDVAVLDISDAALQRARQRIGQPCEKVRWITADVTSVRDLGTFDVWHDRAVFHFLTNVEDRQRYARRATESVRPGGHLVIATFALAGPEQCSGLPVQRYDETSLATAFGPDFSLIKSVQETHVTPWSKPQAFVYAVLERSLGGPEGEPGGAHPSH
ncbi:MAG: class I SAM-dependent methyltransferase [Planctomycetota bacterium]|jgi:2-polyprenyl-3-methyl-5-hydroxy-6-metoxy-1,4-benzoquinol methylase